jgi:hypothetical protein
VIAFRAINLLFISAVLAFVFTLPLFSPENIFTLTSSRLQTPNDVLFTRLGLLRPSQTLTDADQVLRPRIASIDARCLYLAHGPDVLTNCPFCLSDEPTTYFYYALPAILLPHLLHLLALGLATSNAVAGKYGSRWRTLFVMGGAAVGLAECYLVGTYDFKANARATRPEDLDHFYWRMRTFRGISMCILDAAFAGLIWATSTNRIFAVPPSVAERTETVIKAIGSLQGRLVAVGILRNTVVRDEGLRGKAEVYWRREKQVMGDVMDEREVVEEIRNALSDRINVTKIEGDARTYADGILGGLQDAGTVVS